MVRLPKYSSRGYADPAGRQGDVRVAGLVVEHLAAGMVTIALLHV